MLQRGTGGDRQCSAGGVFTLGIIIAIGVIVFLIKLVTVPSAMAREAEERCAAEIAALQRELDAVRDARRSQEAARRVGVVNQLVSFYKLDRDGISTAMMAGLELPPEQWMNNRLLHLGENFMIRIVEHQFQVGQIYRRLFKAV